MKYFVLIVGNGETTPWDEQTPEDQQAELEKHQAFTQACTERDGVEIVSSEALDDAATASTLRTRGGELTITDGPFAEAAEQLGGFYVIDAPDFDTVVELLGILPAYDFDIRPVLDYS